VSPLSTIFGILLSIDESLILASLRRRSQRLLFVAEIFNTPELHDFDLLRQDAAFGLDPKIRSA